MQSFLLVLILTLGLAASSASADHLDSKAYKRFCSDGNQLNYKTLPVKVDTMEQIKRLRLIFWAAAHKYKVDVVSIVGSIAAEHTMNTSDADIVQDENLKKDKAKEKMWDDIYGIAGKHVSYGWGQLHMERAFDAESISARLDGRTPRSNDEVLDNLQTPEGAIDYVGALAYQSQKIYREGGYDISRYPAIVTTLYNIGQVQDHLKRTQELHEQPGPNYFGCFVEDHYDEIVKAMGIDPYLDLQALDLSKNATRVPQVGKVFRARTAVTLANGPIDCFDPPPFPVTDHHVNVNDLVDVLGTAVNCKNKPWLLVRTQSGQTGWINRDWVSSTMEDLGETKKNCKLTDTKECGKALAKKFDGYAAGTAEEGQMVFTLSGGKAGLEAIRTAYESRIYHSEHALRKRAQAYFKGVKVLSDQDKREIAAAIESFKIRINRDLFAKVLDEMRKERPTKEEMKRLQKGGQVYDLIQDRTDRYLKNSQNPYVGALAELENFKSPMAFLNAKIKVTFYANKTALLQYLRDFRVSIQPDAHDVHEVLPSQALGQWLFYDGADIDRYRKSMASITQLDDQLSKIDYCRQSLKGLPQATEFVDYLEFAAKKGYLAAKDPRGYQFPFVEEYPTLSTICYSLRQILDNRLPTDPYCSECTVDVVSAGGEQSQIQQVSAQDAKKQYPSLESRDDLFFSLLRAYRLQVSTNQLKKLLDNRKKNLTSIRDLAHELEADECVKTIYVPKPWLATTPKAIFRPMSTSSDVLVEYRDLVCEPTR